jgi:hypothetical protein
MCRDHTSCIALIGNPRQKILRKIIVRIVSWLKPKALGLEEGRQPADNLAAYPNGFQLIPTK